MSLRGFRSNISIENPRKATNTENDPPKASDTVGIWHLSEEMAMISISVRVSSQVQNLLTHI